MKKNSIYISALFTLLLVSIVLFQNCSEISLLKPLKPPTSPEVFSIPTNIKTCARPSAVNGRKNKSVFIVDMSLSNIGRYVGTTFNSSFATDPNAERLNAILDYINDDSCNTEESEFAFVPFSSVIVGGCARTFKSRSQARAEVQQLINIQNSVKAQCASPAGCGTISMQETSYIRALTCLRETIFNEYELNAGTASGNSYQAFFITDGEPNPVACSGNQPECYVDIVRPIPAASIQEGHTFNLTSISYGSLGSSPILTALSSLTGSTTQQITDLGNLNFCNIQSAEFSRPYFQSAPAIINLTSQLKSGQVEVDSDIDGIIDSLDANPTLRTESNNLLSAIAARLGSTAQSCATISGRRLGMSACDRLAIDVTEDSTDADRDGILDFIEVLRGLNPNFTEDASLDLDEDSLLTWAEITRGSNPLEADSETGSLNLLSYTAAPYTLTDPERPSSCPADQDSWSINISHIPLANTLEFEDSDRGSDIWNLSHEAGENVILIYYIATPRVGSGKSEFWGTLTKVSSSTTEINVLPTDFQFLGYVTGESLP